MSWLAPHAPTLSFAENYLPLEDLCRRLAKAEGTEIRCAPSVRDRKLALFCTNKGADEVRRMVATAAGLRWRETKTGLLAEPDPADVQAGGTRRKAGGTPSSIRSADMRRSLSHRSIRESSGGGEDLRRLSRRA